MFGIITAGLAPGVALMSYFYLRDRYESEPIGMVIRSFILGGLLVFPIMVIEYALQDEHLFMDPVSKAFLANGLLEEFAKWFIVIYTAYHHAEFNERYDGIVYATAVSLGFASVENIFYLFSYGIHEALWRAALPVSSHGLFGVIMGYYIGQAKFSVNKKKWLSVALILAAGLHGIYDFLLNLGTKWIFFIIPFMILLWWVSLRKIKQSHIEHQKWLLAHSLEENRNGRFE
ncbi:glutamic-type intramembrane protease PrsW [Pullulanibacillus sp. KACC 23026]|uniref:glutamic-type intramembrane protease PrsW n=1 Tax=Pullulanibacillus sp. KACC 23026 TaxID=3028315 RepID=UPI0023B0D605|nr:glutamic-type intramembrane protease PrsW [Pullulanibacillus sp. KACC 23026]WEG11395.1 glutamic-type intramembrane protease PrsW [Pullulanibacillus sp. KACC 23026]